MGRCHALVAALTCGFTARVRTRVPNSAPNAAQNGSPHEIAAPEPPEGVRNGSYTRFPSAARRRDRPLANITPPLPIAAARTHAEMAFSRPWQRHGTLTYGASKPTAPSQV
jgi:hypothetical protein